MYSLNAIAKPCSLNAAVENVFDANTWFRWGVDNFKKTSTSIKWDKSTCFRTYVVVKSSKCCWDVDVPNAHNNSNLAGRSLIETIRLWPARRSRGCVIEIFLNTTAVDFLLSYQTTRKFFQCRFFKTPFFFITQMRFFATDPAYSMVTRCGTTLTLPALNTRKL